MATRHAFVVGDTVELRDAYSETVGTVVKVRSDNITVQWKTGEGYAGKRLVSSPRVLRKRATD